MADEQDGNAVLPVPDPQTAVVRARGQLREVRDALDAATGGASARSVLAEMAQEFAADLAAYFDELPMHSFSGAVRREGGLLRTILPRVVPHRVVMARYHSATVPTKAGSGWTRQYARIFVLGLGADGQLRRGRWTGFVQLPDGTQPVLSPVSWDHLTIKRVPSSLLVMRRWVGSTDPADVAEPGKVLEALTAISNGLVAESQKDLALLQKFLAVGP